MKEVMFVFQGHIVVQTRCQNTAVRNALQYLLSNKFRENVKNGGAEMSQGQTETRGIK